MGKLTIPPSAGAAIHAAFGLLPSAMASRHSEVLMGAIGLQESRFLHRRQIIERGGKLLPIGPATGFWQFELGGGTKGVMEHEASRYWAFRLCEARGVPFHRTKVWTAFQHDDVLAAGFARLLLFTDRRALPAPGNAKAAWNYYIRNWRPGKPHPETWEACYEAALDWAED